MIWGLSTSGPREDVIRKLEQERAHPSVGEVEAARFDAAKASLLTQLRASSATRAGIKFGCEKAGAVPYADVQLWDPLPPGEDPAKHMPVPVEVAPSAPTPTPSPRAVAAAAATRHDEHE